MTNCLIIKLYLTCEVDYSNGVKIYEAIVEEKILETAQNQIKTLEKIKDMLYSDKNVPLSVEEQIIKEKV